MVRPATPAPMTTILAEDIVVMLDFWCYNAMCFPIGRELKYGVEEGKKHKIQGKPWGKVFPLNTQKTLSSSVSDPAGSYCIGQAISKIRTGLDCLPPQNLSQKSGSARRPFR